MTSRSVRVLLRYLVLIPEDYLLVCQVKCRRGVIGAILAMVFACGSLGLRQLHSGLCESKELKIGKPCLRT